jgi:hypothetical protein
MKTIDQHYHEELGVTATATLLGAKVSMVLDTLA